jgi:hypothetical protein
LGEWLLLETGVWALAGLLVLGDPIFGEYFPLLGECVIGTSDGISFGGALLGVLLSFLSAGEDRLSWSLDFSDDVRPSFFSIGGISGLAGVVSLPMLLHVCASKASGLFLASSCKDKRRYTIKNNVKEDVYKGKIKSILGRPEKN